MVSISNHRGDVLVLQSRPVLEAVLPRAGSNSLRVDQCAEGKDGQPTSPDVS